MNYLKINRTLFVLILITAMLLSLTACGDDSKDPDTTDPVPPTTVVDIPEDENRQSAFLGKNLYITDIAKYTGMYMEDGSNEFVEDVLMIILENRGDSALQLARISLEYDEFTAKFEVTNLPAGESVVLLEKNRHAYVADNYRSATADNVSFFQEPMSLQEDKVEITGVKGALMVENLTDEPLGEIYIYYKNSAVDLFYGGVTYRARVEAGLKPGRNYTVMTSHYNPSTCTVLDVQIMPLEDK